MACLFSILPGALACEDRDLNVGSERPSNPDGGREDTAACSTLTWGDSVIPASTGDCDTLFLGRWILCSEDGGAPSADSGFPYVLPQPDGIEFAQESGVMRFYVLVRDAAGALQRSQSLNQRGIAGYASVYGNSCDYWMEPDVNSGDQTRWSMALYRNPAALLVNIGNEYASYVPSP
jgi:hypothetical protein